MSTSVRELPRPRREMVWMPPVRAPVASTDTVLFALLVALIDCRSCSTLVAPVRAISFELRICTGNAVSALMPLIEVPVTTTSCSGWALDALASALAVAATCASVGAAATTPTRASRPMVRIGRAVMPVNLGSILSALDSPCSGSEAAVGERRQLYHAIFQRSPNVVLEPQRLVAHTPLLAAVAACRGDFSIVDARSVGSIPAAGSSFADGAFASLLRRFFTRIP